MIKVSFSVWQDEDIVQRIYDAMDVKVTSHKKWDTTLAWFSKAPCLVLIKEPAPYSKGAHRIDAPYQISVSGLVELGALWDTIKPYIGEHYKTPWGLKAAEIDTILPITSPNWWYGVGGWFYHEVDITAESTDFQEWAEAARLYDETWHYADRPNNAYASSQRWLEEKAIEIDRVKCGLYYQHILGKSFLNLPKGSSKDAYRVFNMTPQTPPDDESSGAAYQLHLLKPCVGFPPHDKKVGWVVGDVDHCGQPITKEDWEAVVAFDDDYYYDE